MATVDTVWYVNYGNGSSTGYYAVGAWATGATKNVGDLIRQSTTPTAGNERVFVCIVAGTTHASTEPTWVVTRGAKTTDNTVTWMECTGQAAVNGDATNTTAWTGVKNTAMSLGQIIKNAAGTYYFICTTAGTAGNGSEPTWNTTAGQTTADNTVTWTSLGAVGNFSAWGAPHARLANSFASTWGTAGNTFFVGDNSAESNAAAVTLNVANAAANTFSYIYSIDNTAALPPSNSTIKSGASVSTTASNNITFASATSGCHYFEGIVFTSGNSTGNGSFTFGSGAAAELIMKNCSLIHGGTGAANFLFTGAQLRLRFYSCTFTFNSTGTFINRCPDVAVYGGSIGGATLPTNLFGNSSPSGNFILEGVDLSAFGSGKTLVPTISYAASFLLKNCRLGSSVTVASPTAIGHTVVDLIVSDSSNTNYRSERYFTEGTQISETTIVRTGGATDGTTPISWKIATTSVSRYANPFVSQPMAIWNDTTSGNITVTVYGIWGGGAVPNNDDIWIEVSYLGSSSYPTATIDTSNAKASSLATNSAQGSDSSTWGGSTTAFKMSATIAPRMKGYVYVTVRAAKASTTFYVDPRIVLS